jgi:DNA mismatch repair protein MutS2
MVTFAPGDRVHIARLGTGVVREARNGGRYIVDIKGTTMIVGADRMAPAGERSRKHKAAATPVDAEAPAASGPVSLDLHGKTVDEALEALDTFLNDAILDGRDEVHIVHGRSGGRLKAAVHARLAQLAAARAFRVDPANPGVTVVRL